MFLSVLLITCRQATKSHDVTSEKKVTSEKLKTDDKKKIKEQNIEEFLKQLQVAIKNNNIDYIENSILFPFEHKSGGELVDNYNSYNEIKTNRQFNIIINARYVKGCNDEINKIKYYCITYFDDIIDITFYAIKKENQFKLVRMETPK